MSADSQSTTKKTNIITAGWHNAICIKETAAFAYLTRIWANAQRDGRPAECRWRPLFNAANFG